LANRIGFLLAEDQALKVKLSGIQLSDDRDATRDVQVFFRYPEGETEKKYPFITLELMDVTTLVVANTLTLPFMRFVVLLRLGSLRDTTQPTMTYPRLRIGLTRRTT